MISPLLFRLTCVRARPIRACTLHNAGFSQSFPTRFRLALMRKNTHRQDASGKAAKKNSLYVLDRRKGRGNRSSIPNKRSLAPLAPWRFRNSRLG